MHGMVLNELQRYVNKRHGATVWRQLLKEADTANSFYMPTDVYPDKEMFDILDAAEKISETPKTEILEDFGKFIAPNLIHVFVDALDKKWDAFDLLENTETTIHKMVRRKEPKATPAKLKINRKGTDKVEIIYESNRKLCYFALGLVKGILEHYNETAKVSMPRSMTHGDEKTLIVIER